MTNIKSSGINSNKLRGITALIIVTVLWGGTFTIVKESLRDINSMLFIAFRFLIAGILLFPFVVKKIATIKKDTLKAGIFLGILLFLGFATQTIGLKTTSATKSAFITGSSVVLIPVFQTFIKKIKPTAGSIAGIIVVFIGILFLSSGGNSVITFLDELGSNFNTGDFFTLLCALSFAVYIVYLDILSNKYDFWGLLLLQISVTSVLSFLASFILDAGSVEKAFINLSGTLVFGLLFTSIFTTLITTSLQTKYQKEVLPTEAGIIYSFEPIFAAVVAFFALNEKITNFGFIGCILIFLGLILSEVYDNISFKYAGKRT